MPGLSANACLEEPDALIALVRVCGGAPRVTGGLYAEISNIQHGITNVQVGCRLGLGSDWVLGVITRRRISNTLFGGYHYFEFHYSFIDIRNSRSS